MTRKKQEPSATLLGDLVSSRTARDRASHHRVLVEALEAVNQAHRPVSPLRVTAGDEYQARFATVGEALAAALDLAVRLRPGVDVRHGIGWGEVTVLDETQPVEDGPGWWAARAAIEDVEAASRRAATRHARTAYAIADGQDGPDPHAVNAALLSVDQLLGGLSERSWSVLRGLLSGSSQRELADDLGVSASAVSQRVRHDGLGVVQAVLGQLREVR